jgi:carboxymethylenebutenolidase
MVSQRVSAPVPDGSASADLHLPDGRGPWPVVVFYMDAFGLRPALTTMAARLVSSGFAVLQPDLYWRSGPFAPFDPSTAFVDAAERARIFALMNSFSPAQVIADTAALLDAIDGPATPTDRVGLVGYCMGGRQATFVAAGLGTRVAAMASIHGGGLVRPGPASPHLGGPKISATLYFAVADDDPSCTAADCEALGAALSEAGVSHEIERYLGARHGFAVPDSPAFDDAAAARHWERVVALFERTLR